MRSHYLAWIAVLPLALPLMGQQATPSAVNEAQASNMRTADRHLTLDVVATDKSNKLVSGLQQSSFVVLDNKKPQTITSFRAITVAAPAPDPAKIILLVDEVNTNFSSVAYERNAIKKYLTSGDGKLAHPTTLIFFSDTSTEMMNGYSQDGNALAAALADHDTKLRTLRRSNGFYGAVDRFQLSLQNMQALIAREETQPGRKLLLWISPGWPYLSGVRVDLTQREAQGIFNSVVAISTALRRARITLYSIDPLGTADAVSFRTTFWEEFEKGIASPKDAQAADLSLQVLAYQSGGRVLNSNNDVTDMIKTAASEADNYYEMTLDLPPAEHADEYHAIQVKTEQANITARTRTGYYNQP
jgi:VWFA-related protein